MKKQFSMLGEGCRGYLISCARGRESKAFLEMRTLLNHYADRWYPNRKAADEGGVIDLEKELELEIATTKQGASHRFELRDGGCSDQIILATSDIPASELVEFQSRLFDSLEKGEDEEATHVRFSSVVVPIEATVPAKPELIEKALERLIKLHFHDPAPACTFKVDVKSRNNDSVDRDALTVAIVKMVTRRNRVELKKPEKTIYVRILKGFACVSIVPNAMFPKGMNVSVVSHGEMKMHVNKVGVQKRNIDDRGFTVLKVQGDFKVMEEKNDAHHAPPPPHVDLTGHYREYEAFDQLEYEFQII